MLKHLILAVSVSLLAIACGGGQEQPATADTPPAGDAAKPADAPAGDAKPADAPK